MPRDLQDLGLLYDKDLGDPVNAFSYYREAIELAKQLRAVDRLAALYNNMGAVNWRQKKYRTALAYYQKGLAEMTYRPADTAFTAVIPLAALQMTTNDHFVSTLLANKGESLLALYQDERDPIFASTRPENIPPYRQDGRPASMETSRRKVEALLARPYAKMV